MKLSIFAIYDEKAKAYMQPFFMQNEAMAIRLFSDGINDPQSNFYAHAGDYTMFYIGEFDNENGAIAYDHPHSVVNGLAVKTAREAINREPSPKPLDNSKSDIQLKTDIESARLNQTNLG